MKYELIVSDFDGTLAGYDRIVSKENAAAIAEFIDAGGIFTIGSGRSYSSLCKLLVGMGLADKKLELICLNGSVIKSYPDGKLLKNYPIDKKDLIETALECERRGLYYHLYDSEGLYVADDSEISESYRDYTGTPFTIVGKLSDFISQTDKKITKLLIVTEAEKTLPLIDEFNGLFGRGDSVFFSSNPIFAEMCSRKAGKGHALEFLADYRNVDISKTVAIGDQYNDLPMIERAGLSVAVGNAVDALKAAADYVAPDCSDSAVAHVIRKFCL